MGLFAEGRADAARALELRSISRKAADRSDLETRDERLRIEQVIWEFVLSHGRIVYGGAALRALIGDAAAEGEGEWSGVGTDITDIEFYSPEPGRDVVELCDLFRNEHGMEFVQGREAVHVSTMTISVGFKRCCDVTFMAKRTVAALPCIRAASGVWCVHPHVMAMDLLRMLTEPDTSYWRLEKAYVRLRLLEEHFPLSWEFVEEGDADQPVVDPGLLSMLTGGSAVVVGDHAAGFYEEHQRNMDGGVDEAHDQDPRNLQLVCVEYESDVRAARSVLLGTDLAQTETCMEAFGDLLGRSTRFLDGDGRLIVEMIDAHPRCVPCSPVSSAVGRVGSSLFCLVTAMACHLRAFVTGDRAALSQQSLVCKRLLASRTRSSPGCLAFEDFGLDHIIGKTTSDMVLHTLSKQGPQVRTRSWLRYSPSDGSSQDGARKRMVQAGFVSRTGRVKSVTQLRAA